MPGQSVSLFTRSLGRCPLLISIPLDTNAVLLSVITAVILVTIESIAASIVFDIHAYHLFDGTELQKSFLLEQFSKVSSCTIAIREVAIAARMITYRTNIIVVVFFCLFTTSNIIANIHRARYYVL
jgi:hypothetical protein